jgi:hypothetical protein
MKSRILIAVGFQMKPGILFSNLLLAAVFLALGPTAQASTVWYVDGVNGNDTNDCRTRQTACKTIGHAISLASSGDTIGVGPATYTENLTINFSLQLIGSGASTTIIDGGGVATAVTISDTNAHVALSKVIRNGFAGDGVGANGGGIYNSGTLAIHDSTFSGNDAYHGGGIYNSGTLTINDSALSDNRAGSSCVIHFCPSGGGIYNKGTLTINNSTLNNNRVYVVAGNNQSVTGGGIGSYSGTLTINNSTISGNTAYTTCDFCYAPASGGGIYQSGGTVTINNSTISSNSAAGRDGSYGGGIFGMSTLQNSIVANNSSGGNCSGTMTSNGYNLSSDGTCNFNGPGDLNNTNPLLGPLQNNGGPTQTQALLPGSPAIDAGNPNGCTDGSGHLLKTDQRGAPRPDKEDTGGCDMGAFERQSD